MTEITAPTVTARCEVESDGYHVHVYEVGEGYGRVSITHDFRTWDSEHTVPAAPSIDAWAGPKFVDAYASVHEAVAALAPGAEVPALACKVEAFNFRPVYARIMATAQSVRPTPEQAARIDGPFMHRQAACVLRMVATTLEAAARWEPEGARGVFRASAGHLRWQAAEHVTAAS